MRHVSNHFATATGREVHKSTHTFPIDTSAVYSLEVTSTLAKCVQECEHWDTRSDALMRTVGSKEENRGTLHTHPQIYYLPLCLNWLYCSLCVSDINQPTCSLELSISRCVYLRIAIVIIYFLNQGIKGVWFTFTGFPVFSCFVLEIPTYNVVDCGNRNLFLCVWINVSRATLDNLHFHTQCKYTECNHNI